jgi:hypothetical protein
MMNQPMPVNGSQRFAETGAVAAEPRGERNGFLTCVAVGALGAAFEDEDEVTPRQILPD